MTKKLIVLDLDETLIHSCNEWIGHPCDFTVANAMVHVRPGITEFLNAIYNNNDVAVWTASTGQYLDELVSQLFAGRDLKFIWDRSYCDIETDQSGYDIFVKDTAKLCQAGYNNLLLIDDRPENISPDSERVLAVKPFYGSRDDCELYALAEYISQITV